MIRDGCFEFKSINVGGIAISMCRNTTSHQEFHIEHEQHDRISYVDWKLTYWKQLWSSDELHRSCDKNHSLLFSEELWQRSDSLTIINLQTQWNFLKEYQILKEYPMWGRKNLCSLPEYSCHRIGVQYKFKPNTRSAFWKCNWVGRGDRGGGSE